MPPGWQWPAFCLEQAQPEIQVYVVDEEDVRARGGWVDAKPVSRIRDEQGFDQRLLLEFRWLDGQAVLKEFGPEHIRQRNNCATVLELLQVLHNSSILQVRTPR